MGKTAKNTETQVLNLYYGKGLPYDAILESARISRSTALNST